MPNPISVRAVERTDFDEWLPLWEGYNAFYGRLLGLTHYLFHRSTIAVEPNCYLQDLFTNEQARGKGVGTALINEVYARAKLAGSKRVYWQTPESNETAMRLYN
jgi:GNAT superfamily N-acetyltransferase